MAGRDDLVDWVFAALKDHGGEATVIEVARHIWANHEPELRAAGDLFYSWQYDMRWAATKLRRMGKMEQADRVPRGIWALK